VLNLGGLGRLNTSAAAAGIEISFAVKEAHYSP